MLEVEMRTPHVYTGGTVRVDRSHGGVRIGVVDLDTGEKTGVARASLGAAIRGLRNVRLTVECTAADATVEGVEIDAIFQHNMYARPYLVAGRNEVVVECEGAEGSELEIRYAWVDAEGRRHHRQSVDGGSSTYEIDVSGNEAPRMLSLRLSARKEAGDGGNG
jgi:hypothetical protein